MQLTKNFITLSVGFALALSLNVALDSTTAYADGANQNEDPDISISVDPAQLFELNVLDEDGNPKPFVPSGNFDPVTGEPVNANGVSATIWEAATQAQQQSLDNSATAAEQLMQQYLQANGSPPQPTTEDEEMFLSVMLGTEHATTSPPPPCLLPGNNGHIQYGSDYGSHQHCYYSYSNSSVQLSTDGTIQYGGGRANCRFDINCVGHRKRHSCFSPESEIQLADKSTKQIKHLNVGDMVWNPVLGKATRVEKVVAGPEATPLYLIGFGDNLLKVTHNHPMVTPVSAAAVEQARLVNASMRELPEMLLASKNFEVRKASELALGDMAMGADGKFHKITVFKKLAVEEGQIVYNLVLQGDKNDPRHHVVVSDGFATGDYLLQNEINKTLVH